MEGQLDEALLLVLGQGSEDLSGIQQMVLFQHLVGIVSKQWQVQQEHKPVTINEEENSHDRMQTSLRKEAGVQFVTQLDWIDIITLQIRVHDGEKHLCKQVKCVDAHSKDKQPRLC